MTVVELTDEVKDLKNQIKDLVEGLAKQCVDEIEKAEITEGVARANHKEDIAV